MGWAKVGKGGETVPKRCRNGGQKWASSGGERRQVVELAYFFDRPPERANNRQFRQFPTEKSEISVGPRKSRFP